MRERRTYGSVRGLRCESLVYSTVKVMMPELFDAFPYLENDKVIIRKMKSSDVVELSEISNNNNVYEYMPPFLYKKSNKTLETAIINLSKRDFEKKRLIIAGIYLKDNPNILVGLAELFDYKKRKTK